MTTDQDLPAAGALRDTTWGPLLGVLSDLRKFRLVVEHTHNMVVITDAQRRIEYVNPAYTAVTGWSLDEVRGRKPGSFLQGPRTSPDTVRQLSQLLSQGQPVCDVEILNYDRQRREYWVSLNIQPVRNASNEITHFVAIQADVTERRRTLEALRVSERRLLEAQRAARMASFECDLTDQRLSWSDDACRVLGCDPRDLPVDVQAHVQALQPDDREALLDAYWEAVSAHTVYEVEYRVVGQDQRQRWIRERGQHLPAEGVWPERISGLIQDISAQRAAQARIEYLALFDTLTGLANREQLKTLLRRRVASGQGEDQPLAVLFLDLDRFKTINDSLGHHMGDEVLRVVGERLCDSVRASDLVCRLGGDEFVVVLTDVGEPDVVRRLCDKLLTRIAEPVLCHGRELHITASVGVSLFPRDGQTVEELMRHADAAMYQAKEQGRNTLSFFCPALRARTGERFELESRLRLALQRRELMLHYQPQFDARTGQLTGFEALLRWPQADGSWITPDRFIPVAEDSGLIVPIGQWVLQHACEQWRAWRDTFGVSVRMSVNVSARQLRDQGLEEFIASLLSTCQLEPHALELELTETVAMHDPGASIELMRRLRKLGVGLAVDDFGTGYSSLAYLKTLPIQRLKLDRSFVKDIEVDPDDMAICSAAIVMAHSLGLQVVAEGVETAAQQTYLREQGCDLMQGYLLGRPQPATAAASWLASPAMS